MKAISWESTVRKSVFRAQVVALGATVLLLLVLAVPASAGTVVWVLRREWRCLRGRSNFSAPWRVRAACRFLYHYHLVRP